ncbi:MAG: hypothetical protein RIS44_1740 [Pseudomonadota bacterium]|jgi:hypothetical protein
MNPDRPLDNDPQKKYRLIESQREFEEALREAFALIATQGWASSNLKCDTLQPVRCHSNGNKLLAHF